MKAKIKLTLTLIPTIILLIYGIELATRVITADGKAEYLIVVIILILLLIVINSRFYSNYKNKK